MCFALNQKKVKKDTVGAREIPCSMQIVQFRAKSVPKQYRTWLILASAAVLYLRLKNIYFFASCEHNVWYREPKRLRVFFKYWKVCIDTVCPVSDQRKNCRISFLMQISDQIPGIPRVLNSRSRRSVGCSKVWKWSKMVRWFGSDEFEPLRSFCLSFTRPGDFKYRR